MASTLCQKCFHYSIWSKYLSNNVWREVRLLMSALYGSIEEFKGCGMGPWLVLVSPSFMENVAATSKIGSFLCSLDNLLQKNVIVFSFGKLIKFQNSAHLKNGLFLTYFSHFLVTREKLQKFLQHISHSHTCTYFAHPIDLFALPTLKKIRIYQVWFLFGMIPGVDSYSRHFGTINKKKWWAKFKLEFLLLIRTYTNAKFIVICKLRTLNDGGEDSVKYRNCKKHCFFKQQPFCFLYQ